MTSCACSDDKLQPCVCLGRRRQLLGRFRRLTSAIGGGGGCCNPAALLLPLLLLLMSDRVALAFAPPPTNVISIGTAAASASAFDNNAVVRPTPCAGASALFSLSTGTHWGRLCSFSIAQHEQRPPSRTFAHLASRQRRRWARTATFPCDVGAQRRRSGRRTTSLSDRSDGEDDEHDTGGERSSLAEEEKNVATLRSRIAGPFRRAYRKFRSRPGPYVLIPFIAAFVGWFTNWLAVQMIFYPIEYRGLSLYRRPEVPLGFLGWQGIVPCKTRKMSETMVEMVTTQLLDVKEVFRRLDPRKVSDLLAPEVPKIGQSVLDDVFPKWLASVPRAVLVGLPAQTQVFISDMNHKFLRGFTVAMQDNIDSVLSVRNCVVEQMLADRTLLGKLFRKCGQKELDFLTNSGLWFGFLLGLIQMMVALFWENPWSLSFGGMIVGLATNWLALKWIFEPINPTRFGPFLLQGMFLKRQKEVAAEFSDFFSKNVLSSEKLWNSILTDPQTTPAFHDLFSKHLINFALGVTTALRITPEMEMLQMAARRAIGKLPDHVGVLHSYVDSNLGLRETLKTQMELMTSEKFERVLHPIFEEDELTLILAGGALGFAAGLIQQGLETGQLKIPKPKEVWQACCRVPGKIQRFSIRDSASSALRVMEARVKAIRRKLQHRSDSSQMRTRTDETADDEASGTE